MDVEKKVTERLEGILTTHTDLFVVDVAYHTKGKKAKLVILLDGDQGITIDQCAQISRSLSQQLEEAPLIEEAFTLEVSSPGVDTPLKLQRQYPKNIGRTIKFTLQDERTLTGVLKAVTTEQIAVDLTQGKGKKKKTETIDIPFTAIQKAVVQVSFK
ncbi:MAG: ribosome maturation factor RimP [Thermonemataceae bacterium]